jgi:hypothetical protein
MPIVVGEFGANNNPATFDTNLMNWGDTNGYSYLAWTWDQWGCSGVVIIVDYTGTPCSPNGTAIKNHYVTIGTKPTTTTTKAITAPTAPRAPWAAPGDAQATVHWTAPASSGGASLTGYVVTPYLNGTAQTPRAFTSLATTEVISGLANTKSYTFRVAAKNPTGTGPSSGATTPVVIGTPTVPRQPFAIPGNGQVKVAWTAPVSNGGASISGYVITPYRSGVAQNPQTFNSNATSEIITKLANTDTYVFRVAAKNARGTGQRSAPTPPVTVGTPTAPQSPSAVAGINLATVKWSAPVSNNGSAIVGYVVTPYLSGVAQTAHAFQSIATTQVITGLTAGATYSFRVAATNARGVGQQSHATAPVVIKAASVAVSGAMRPADTNRTGRRNAYQSAR